MTLHRNERIYIGPKTNEVIVSVGRSYGVDVSGTQVIKLEFSRRGFADATVSVWNTYKIVKEHAHFELPTIFLTDIISFPKGFYDGKVFVDDCHVSDIELVKAPGHYVIEVDAIQDACLDGDWVEPDCLIVDPEQPCCGCSCNGDPDEECECIYKVKNNCPTCYNEIITQTVDITNDYVDWDNDDCET